MRRGALRPGDLVRSRYRARWVERVLALEELRDGAPVTRNESDPFAVFAAME